MKAERLKEFLQEKLEQIPILKEQNRSSQDFLLWREETQKILEHFGKRYSIHYLHQFRQYHFCVADYRSLSASKADHHKAFLNDLDRTEKLLKMAIDTNKELYKKSYNYWELTHPVWWIYQLYRRIDSLCSKIVWLENKPIIRLISILGALASIIGLVLYVYGKNS